MPTNTYSTDWSIDTGKSKAIYSVEATTLRGVYRLRQASAPIKGQWCVEWQTHAMGAPAFNYYPTFDQAHDAFTLMVGVRIRISMRGGKEPMRPVNKAG